MALVSMEWSSDIATFFREEHGMSHLDDPEFYMAHSPIVKVRDIDLTSTCEHHFVTIDGMARVAYIPADKVIGLSKINRIVRFFAQRPQVQERLTQQVLVAGSNFGCGSSREHAPWSLLDYGFRAVVSSRFADIFRSNALKNGLLPLQVDEAVADHLFDHPDQAVRIDIANRTFDIQGYGRFEFPLEPFSAYCLTRGIDQLDFILQNEAAIEAYEDKL